MFSDAAPTRVPDGLFRRVVPAAPVRPRGGGRCRHGDRQVLAAIASVATTGCMWRQLPPDFGPSGPTVHRRFTEWSRAQAWDKLHRLALDGLGARGELDWSRCAIDSANKRATKGGLAGLNPVDRGKKGSKIHLITERTGLHLSIGISAVHTHDSQGLEPLVRGIPPIHSPRGPRRRRPAKLHGDKGYDYGTTCGNGSARETSPRSSPAGASSPPKSWAATGGPQSGRWRGYLGAAACTVATSARLRISWPSPVSRRS